MNWVEKMGTVSVDVCRLYKEQNFRTATQLNRLRAEVCPFVMKAVCDNTLVVRRREEPRRSCVRGVSSGDGWFRVALLRYAGTAGKAYFFL